MTMMLADLDVADPDAADLDVAESTPVVPLEFLPGIDEDFADPPEPPAWVFEAAREALHDDVRRSAADRPGERTAAALELADPGELDAASLLDGIVGLARLCNWAQALQQRYIATLATPGVVASTKDLLALARASTPSNQPPDDSASAAVHDPHTQQLLSEASAKAASAEIGAALHMSPVSARNRVEHAITMTSALPATLAAQQAGDIDGYRAKIIAERTAGLTADQRSSVEADILPRAATRTPGRLRALVDKKVTQLDADAARQREKHARHGRGTTVYPDGDGMGNFLVHAPAPDVETAHSVLNRIATAITATGLADGRGRSQIRADAFAAIFHDLAATGHFTITDKTSASNATTSASSHATSCDPTTANRGAAPSVEAAPCVEANPSRCTNFSIGNTPGEPDSDPGNDPSSDVRDARQIRATRSGTHRPPICVNVYVNATTLAGFDDDPAELAGHGVITASYARDIAASAAAVRTIITTPSPLDSAVAGTTTAQIPIPSPGHSANPARQRTCGTVYDAGHIIYRPPPGAAEYITSRDRTCCFPGCATAATQCDIDHRTPYRQPQQPSNKASANNAEGSGPDHANSRTRETSTSTSTSTSTYAQRTDSSTGGATCPCNLDALCRFHHLIKTFLPWNASPNSTGTLTWTAPTKNRYRTEPAHPLHDNPDDPGRPDRPGWFDPRDKHSSSNIRNHSHNSNGSEAGNNNDDPPPY